MTFGAKITGTGSAFPARRVTNDDLARHLATFGIETSDDWIRERTGISERFYSDPSDENENNASLAAAAAVNAMEMAGKSPGDIDQIIVATCSPESTLPAIACWLQKKIGAANAWAMDINSACTGFIYGLVTASQFIQTGHTKTALVIGSEVLHPLLNWEDRTSCILFGDAAGAAIVERTNEADKSRVLNWQLKSDGNCAELLYIPVHTAPKGSDYLNRPLNDGKLEMNGREIFKVAVRTLTEFARSVLDDHGVGIDDVDWLVPHQANQRILEAVAQRLGIPFDKVLINVNRCGNTSSATIPTILDEAVRDGRIRKGQLLLLDAFGAGFTYGAVLVRW